MKSFNPIFLFLLELLLFMMGSCVSSKKVIYMNDISDSTTGKLGLPQINFENPIQKNDQLQITVSGSNLQDLAIFNSGAGVGQLGAINPGSIGYLVESDGKIEIPYLGRLKAEGLTRLSLQDTLAEKLRDYTKNPVVNIRFLNYYVSVLGEVSRPGRYNMPNERLTILEAIAIAGDIGIFGRSNNVMIIREDSGRRQYGRINLLQSDLFRSPYFYLKTNDVVYVEPLPARFISRNGIPQYLGIVAVGLSLVLTTINLIAK